MKIGGILVRRWTLDVRRQTLDAGHWTLDVGPDTKKRRDTCVFFYYNFHKMRRKVSRLCNCPYFI
jgi:hypothetical protein